MAHLLSEHDVSELVSVLSASYVVDACGGTVRIITAPLPDKAVCVIRDGGDGLVYMVVDVEKPLAYRHARQMLREWRSGYVEPVVTDNGAIELVPLSRTPEPDGPCTLILVG